MGLTSYCWSLVKDNNNTWSMDPKVAAQFQANEVADYYKFKTAITGLADSYKIHMAWNQANGVWEWEIDGWNWPWEDESEGQIPQGGSYGTGANQHASDTSGTSRCIHEWVNISFHHLHMACKYCGVDKPEQ
jgi:hypothetical protein